MMGQRSMVGRLRWRLWQGHRLFSHEDLSPKPCLRSSSQSTMKGMRKHVFAEPGEASITAKTSFWPFCKGYRTSTLHSKAHLTSSCTPPGGRSFSSFQNNEPLSSLEWGSSAGSASSTQSPSTTMDTTEDEVDTSSTESVEDFDFRNFPALKSSFFQDYERPSEMQQRRTKRAFLQSKKLFDAGTKLTVESIPKARGRVYDFGLVDAPMKPPPLEAGSRPQGGFDIDISLENWEEVSSESLLSSPVFPQRATPLDLHGDNPSVDNLSEISRDPHNTEDSVVEAEQEFWWDPHDFDAHRELPDKLAIEE